MTALPRPSQILLVGQKIRQIRKSRRLTQADLAGRIGVTQSDLSRMENGEYKVGLDTLFKILQIFELSMSTFFEEPVEVVEVAEAPEQAASAANPTNRKEAQETLLADWAYLSNESQQEVRDFIAFKRQQEARLQRWKPENPDGTEGEGA